MIAKAARRNRFNPSNICDRFTRVVVCAPCQLPITSVESNDSCARLVGRVSNRGREQVRKDCRCSEKPPISESGITSLAIDKVASTPSSEQDKTGLSGSEKLPGSESEIAPIKKASESQFF